MPTLAVELDAIRKAAHVARAANISEDSVLGGLLRMWEFCWREKTDRLAPVAVRGFFGADATLALVTFQFLEPADEGFRVRGAARYLRISEGNKAGGERAKGHLIPGPKPKGEPKGSRRGPEGGAEEDPKEPFGSPSALQLSAFSFQHSPTKEEEGSLSATQPAPVEERISLERIYLPREAAEQLQALWAEEADSRLARWKESGPERRKAASNALRQRKLREGPDSWLDVIQRVNVTPFLLGANDRGWKATLDWLLKPGRAAKVLEGNYAVAEAGAAPPKAPAAAPFGVSNAWQGAWCARCDGPAAYEHDAVALCWEHLPQEARPAHA